MAITRIKADTALSGTIPATNISSASLANVSTGTSWQAVKTTSFTAVAGEGYFVDTTSGAITITLPSSPSIGDEVTIVDYAGTFTTNNVTLNRNGNNIKGSAANETLSTSNGAYTYVYIDGTQGWKNSTTTDEVATYISATGGTVTESGDYKLHTFTGDGTFCVSDNGNQTQAVTITVVGGGAGGGNRHGGGGGAGGLTVGQSVPITAQAYPISVGAGGNGSSAPTNRSIAGSNSSGVSFVGIGGGAAGSQGPLTPGQPGGSGGGSAVGGAGGCVGPAPSGSATQPGQPQPAASVFNAGSAGGQGGVNPGPDDGGGGGGGATSAGIPSNPSNPNFSDGGAGKDISPFVNIAPVYPNSAIYAGGGGGGANNNPEGGTGGVGGGGDGAPSGAAGSNGTTNTGGGGGGSGTAPQVGGNGGSGIVLIEYKYR